PAAGRDHGRGDARAARRRDLADARAPRPAAVRARRPRLRLGHDARPSRGRAAVRFPNESGEYRAARDRLPAGEKDLREQAQAVAALRRELPPGGVVAEDSVFEGADGEVRLSELFGDYDTLVIYSFMFPRTADDDTPCWSCSSILDSLDGAARHL